MARFDVWPTPVGREDIDGLPDRARRLAEQRMREMETQGCKKAGYRLQGHGGVEHICCVWLTDNYRLITAFPNAAEIVVLLAGPHDEEREDLDVYRTLYGALGLTDYPTGDPLHPDDCCDETGDPPVDADLLDRFIASAKSLRAERRRAMARRRRRR